MEKETLLTALKGVIGNPDENGNYKELGISTRTLDGYVDSVLPSIAEDADIDNVAKIHAGILKNIGGQLRHDVAEALKKMPKTEPQGIKTEPKEPEPDNQLQEQLAALQNSMNALQQKLTDSERAKMAEKLKGDVKSLMKAQGATDNYVLDVVFRGRDIDTAKSASELAELYLPEYDKEYAAARGGGATPRVPGGGGGKVHTVAEDFFASKAKKEGWGDK